MLSIFGEFMTDSGQWLPFWVIYAGVINDGHLLKSLNEHASPIFQVWIDRIDEHSVCGVFTHHVLVVLSNDLNGPAARTSLTRNGELTSKRKQRNAYTMKGPICVLTIGFPCSPRSIESCRWIRVCLVTLPNRQNCGYTEYISVTRTVSGMPISWRFRARPPLSYAAIRENS
jgi:hypothetical protein